MAKQPLAHWLKSEDGKRFTTLTEDGYWFCISWIGDGWVWMVFKIVAGKGTSVSPEGRVIRKTVKECAEEARHWYRKVNPQYRADAEKSDLLKRIQKL
jgi:hypothetical protein